IIFLKKKLILKRLYKKFIEQNRVLQLDVEETFIARGCQSKVATVQKKFEHLMLYYPEFAFIFLWRTNQKNHRFAKLFLQQDYLCKIFRSTKILGGLN